MPREALSRILLVGESNPYGADPTLALYPLPEHASGGRLARILGLSRSEYLRRHDRANLCDGPWRIREARVRARALFAPLPPGAGVVLLGAKVAEAFGEPYTCYEVRLRLGVHLLVLPHPSGLNRAWNAVGSVQRARDAYQTLCQRAGVPA